VRCHPDPAAKPEAKDPAIAVGFVCFAFSLGRKKAIKAEPI
jgi:hypothetical protein